ncbi:glycosyltransferase [Maricaulis parjimensis]|uniref:glycosyltransferase n=1 Tax=Maricaulis parjimensis TaxID=144023 RepID=UPI001939DFB7|nr:glycosyltransferase [Maricaulis parjimensis]
MSAVVGVVNRFSEFREKGVSADIALIFDAEYYIRSNPDVGADEATAIAHYLRIGWAEGRNPSPLFDNDAYLDAYPDVAEAGFNPLVHYVGAGAKEMRNPHPLFDSSWYLERNPDVVTAGINPLAHYLSAGAAEGRTPNPLFDPKWYKVQAGLSGIAGALEHYILEGAKQGFAPHPLFDGKWYLEQYTDLAERNVNPLAHYLARGAIEHRQPHPLFDAKWYLSRYDDVARAGVNPLVHYVCSGGGERRWPNPLFDPDAYSKAAGLRADENPLKHFIIKGLGKGVATHPLFDAKWYLDHCGDAAAARANPLAHYLQYGAAEKSSPHPLFDAAWYLNEYPDVAASGLNPLVHFVELGWKENRNPSAYFDVRWYLKSHQDVAKAGINPLVHYLSHGWKEGRATSERFDTQFYLEENDDIERAKLNPLAHYIHTGRYEGRTAVPMVDPKSKPGQPNLGAAIGCPVVVYESHNLKLQGAPNSLFEIAKGVHSRRHFQPVLMANEPGPLSELYDREGIQFVAHGVSQNRMKDASLRDGFIQKLADLYKEINASVVHVNTLQNFHCILAADRAGIPSVWNVRESEDPETYYDYLSEDLREMAYSAFDKVSTVVFVADATRKLWLPKLQGVAQSQTILNGIDADRLKKFVHSADRRSIRKSYGIEDDDVVVLCVGTVIPRKGQQDITAAIARLDDKAKSRVVLAIVGLNASEYSRTVRSEMEALEAQGIRTIAIEESRSDEQRKSVAELYKASDVFVLSSRIESYPRVVLEAMEFGLAVVSTPCFGVKEQLVDGESALFYEEGDADELASHIGSFVNDDERRANFARAAHDRLKVLNNYEQMLAAYEGVYRRLLATKEGRPSHQSDPRSPADDVAPEAYSHQLSILVISRTPENMSRVLQTINRERLSAPFEVLCSWNGDTESANDIDIPAGMDFRLIEQRPYNFARNNNGLAAKARGRYLLFLNDDVIADEGAIRSALCAIKDPTVGMVGINLRYQDDRLQHAGVFFDEHGKPFHRLKHQVKWDDPSIAADEFVPCVTGAFIMMRAAEFNAVRFDEAFNVCGEDIALNLSYRERFDREILYVATATAVHVENATRKKTGETKTPAEDMERILSYSRREKAGCQLTEVRRPKVRIVTEKPGWIMHRKAAEIQRHFGEKNVRINQDWSDAEIHYYINYGYFRAKPKHGITVANFTHYDPDHLADKFEQVAHEVDHCIAVSEATADVLRGMGVPDDKISVIVVGADVHFQPLLTLGVVGRVYPGGRKGEDIIKSLQSDPEVVKHVRIVAAKEGWESPVWSFDDPADFYRAVDYLLVPSRLEGGPVPFMEALACGTMSIAPEIGVVPQFPHISYPTGDVEALKKVILDLASKHVEQRMPLTKTMRGVDWAGWSVEHEKLFRFLLAEMVGD